MRRPGPLPCSAAAGRRGPMPNSAPLPSYKAHQETPSEPEKTVVLCPHKVLLSSRNCGGTWDELTQMHNRHTLLSAPKSFASTWATMSSPRADRVLQRARPRAWLGRPMTICRTKSAVKALIGRVICSSLTTATPDPAVLGRWYSRFPKPTGPFVLNKSSAGGQVPGHTRLVTYFQVKKVFIFISSTQATPLHS